MVFLSHYFVITFLWRILILSLDSQSNSGNKKILCVRYRSEEKSNIYNLPTDRHTCKRQTVWHSIRLMFSGSGKYIYFFPNNNLLFALWLHVLCAFLKLKLTPWVYTCTFATILFHQLYFCNPKSPAKTAHNTMLHCISEFNKQYGVVV